MPDKDDFWELNLLAPDRKPSRRAGWDTSAIDIHVDHTEPPRPAFKIPPAEELAGEEPVVHVNYNSSIKRVEVCSWRSKYSLYGDFARTAAEVAGASCPAGEYRYFFSYRPQYRELEPAQLRWYLTWRDKIRAGVYEKTDLSYITLYIYELINTTDIADPQAALDGLIGVWRSFREDYPRLDKYMAEYVTDMCLIHNLRMDMAGISDFFEAAIENSSLKDFYLNLDSFDKPDCLPRYLPYISSYDYKKSRFYSEETTKVVFDEHICRMVGGLMSDRGIRSAIEERFATMAVTQSREAFVGAACAYKYKKLIKCQVVSYLRSFEFKSMVANLIKYAENCCRMHLGMKNRLYQVEIDPTHQRWLDAYAARHLPPPRKAGAPEEREEAPREFKVDLASAASIERESWSITEKLLELHSAGEGLDAIKSTFVPITDEVQYEPDPEPEPEQITEPVASSAQNEYAALVASLSQVERELLEASFEPSDSLRAAAQRDISRREGCLVEMMIGAINEKAYSLTGDVVYDTATGSLLEDYTEVIRGLLQ